MQSNLSLFVVIPAYFEEKTIGQVIDDVRSYTRNIVVVDDASKDQTSTIAKDHGAVVLRHLVNRGQGAALQTGNDYALKHGAEIIVHFDADGQHQAKNIPKVVEPLLREDVDVVLGSRFMYGGMSNIPVSKRLFILPVARWVNFGFTGLSLTDGHNGWRAMNRKAARLISITQDRMAHNTEIPYLIGKHKLSFKEVPVDVVYKEYGQGFGDGVKIVWDLVKNKFIK